MNANHPVPPPPPPLTPDQKAAHELLTELRTRIATQPLPYQHGREDRALASLYEIFDLSRKAIKDHPGCEAFASEATRMMNTALRPVMAKWHVAKEEGWLGTRDGGDEFRGDLQELQKRLRNFAGIFQLMAYGRRQPDALTKGPMDPHGNPPVDPMTEILAPLAFGIPERDAKVWRRVGNEKRAAVKASLLNDAEKAEVLARRVKMASGDCDKTEPKDAIGLAFSGGGIRSATFCLGVAQHLAEKGLLRDVDFLSTVSGGGYTGSFLTQVLGTVRNAVINGVQAPVPVSSDDWKRVASPHGPDTSEIRRLRVNAKFISARSAWQAWGMAISTLAGMFVNWMVPLAVVTLLAAAVTTWNLGRVAHWWVPMAGLACSVATAWLYFGSLRLGGLLSRFFGGLLGLAALVTVLSLAALGEQALYRLLFPDARSSFDSIAKLWQTLSASPLWKAMGITGFTLGGLFTTVPTIIRYVRVLEDPAKRKWVLKAALVVAAVFVPLLGLFSFLLLVGFGKVEANKDLAHMSGSCLLWMLSGILFVLVWLLLNINQTGPHRLYRDSLSKTFVEVTPALEGNTPLSGINATQAAPYHLINTAVNLPTSRADGLRERKCDFFMFSKNWSGSPAVGYFKTESWRMNGRKADLATAMAISGAAFSANMGLGSIPPLRALLAFLNVRLGFWIWKPAPGLRECLARWTVPGFFCLLREMSAQFMSERACWLNLSDGGHIENLGVYELLRRRCKFIVCVDGEADPEFTFQGLMTVVRHAQIDMGVRIHPDLDDVRQDAKTTYSRSHYHLCRVNYPDRGPGSPAGTGLLLYLKLSVTGNESELIRRYRGSNPTFPHQSTLDQFFDEEQFEAYRQLGVHAAEGLFQSCLMGGGNTPAGDYKPTSMKDWFTRLAKNLLE